MTDQPTPTKKTPWLFIVLGVLAVLCICLIASGIAIFAFLVPSGAPTIVTEAPVEATPEMSLPTSPAQNTESSLFDQAAPIGSAVEIGNGLTLTILGTVRPADELVANGNAFNTTAPEGEEFIQLDVEVTCASDAGTSCRFFPTVMRILLPNGSTRDLQTFLEGVDDWDTAVDIPAGETRSGFLLFIIPQAETRLIVSYQDVYAEEAVYFQLP